MALFSLLIAIMVERLKLLPKTWQLESLLALYTKLFFGSKQLKSELMMAIALLLPMLAIQITTWAVQGMFWGGLSLLLWVGVSILCFSHQRQRIAFKRYMQAACRGDAQACYHFAEELDRNRSVDAVSEGDLGAKVGQSVAWINYRFYGAVALYLIFFGPAGAILYCTVRYYADESHQNSQELPIVDNVLMLLDWLPSRIFSFGYVLSGQFTQAFNCWRKLGFSLNTSARDIISQVAMAAEATPETSAKPICVQSTLAFLQLSKRNFILLLTTLSLLTIFGVVT
ncbi:beta-lactamase regulator AmpE [Shewanella sp. UCD-KL12]|uniref:beta-lactamase regulator AmpE n=1 Tax=Shewanella sp. UCD-KL12 TaxID=1917163 RepID=UPI0009704B6E|nr:beta-lactamase regulator AmpE [Shewanella sp. UCD-KL12]